MRVEFDSRADATHIYTEEMPLVAWTYPCDSDGVRGTINLDFEAAGRLIGVEIPDASTKLPLAFLESEKTLPVGEAEKVGRRSPEEGDANAE